MNQPVGQSPERRSPVKDDDDEDVGNGGEEKEQGEEDVNDDAGRSRDHRPFQIHSFFSNSYFKKR